MEDVLADVRRIVEAKRGCLWSVDRQVGSRLLGSYQLINSPARLQHRQCFGALKPLLAALRCAGQPIRLPPETEFSTQETQHN
jgi:hypothetical protein